MDRHHREAGYGVGPPPPERGVENEANEEDRREDRAEVRLTRIGAGGVAAEPGRHAPIPASEERQHDEGKRRDDDPDTARLRTRPLYEPPDRGDADVCG